MRNQMIRSKELCRVVWHRLRLKFYHYNPDYVTSRGIRQSVEIYSILFVSLVFVRPPQLLSNFAMGDFPHDYDGPKFDRISKQETYKVDRLVRGPLTGEVLLNPDQLSGLTPGSERSFIFHRCLFSLMDDGRLFCAHSSEFSSLLREDSVPLLCWNHSELPNYLSDVHYLLTEKKRPYAEIWSTFNPARVGDIFDPMSNFNRSF